MDKTTPVSPRRITLAAGLDAALVVLFTAAGRSTHAAESTLAGLWHTSWPFLTALAAGWIVSRAWRKPLGILNPGFILWGFTLMGGMGLRLLSGQGTAFPFVLVAAGTLLLFLVGWRGIAAGLRLLSNPETGTKSPRKAAPEA